RDRQSCVHSFAPSRRRATGDWREETPIITPITIPTPSQKSHLPKISATAIPKTAPRTNPISDNFFIDSLQSQRYVSSVPASRKAEPGCRIKSPPKKNLRRTSRITWSHLSPCLTARHRQRVQVKVLALCRRSSALWRAIQKCSSQRATQTTPAPAP